jgi:hypothetical protein
MLKLTVFICTRSFISAIKITKNIFYFAAVLQLIFAFLLIFTPFLDNYLDMAGSPYSVKFFSICIAFLFLTVNQLLQVLAEKIEEEIFYRS